MKLLILFFVFLELGTSIEFGAIRVTQQILGKLYTESGIGRSTQLCNEDNTVTNTVKNTQPSENSFLDLANFLEYVQLTSIPERSRRDAIRFFNISTAAFNYGSHLVAQESFGRAVNALGNFRERETRVKRNANSQDEVIDIWDPADLFREFKSTMGVEKFEQLLHLRRQVTMSFVIDSSSSMANDMGHVRTYIEQLLVEQERSGTDATFIVTTFADPSIGETKEFHHKAELMRYLEGLETNVGGDCEEKTCLGILRAMYNQRFLRKGNAAMYIFTDAGSKDCERVSFNIIRTFQFCKASAFFILFDSCRKNIDPNYALIAQRTGGFCLLVRDKAVYNITDTVNGAFESSSLVVGEDTDDTSSRVGQGYGPYVSASRRDRGKRDTEDSLVYGFSSKKTIQIDELIESFKVTVTISPPDLVEKVELIKPLGGDDALCSDDNIVIHTSVADNGVQFDVKAKKCPCVGNWTLAYPAVADGFTYSVNSIGKYTLSFEAYFIDNEGGTQNANHAPCLAVNELLMIKLNQGAQVVPQNLTLKIVGLSGNYEYITKPLLEYQQSVNTYLVRIRLPASIGSNGFRIALEGDIVRGSRFQRLSSEVFYPTTSCFRITNVRNYYALFPNQKTAIYFKLSNNSPVDDRYTILCSNSEDYDIEVGHPRIISADPSRRRRTEVKKSNPVRLEAGSYASYTVTVSAPENLVSGRSVIVNCVASSEAEQMIEFIRLTEMNDPDL
ncbi:hypothetical protein ACHWQZ_G018971 [Mnemiopsis leidyi]